MARPDLGFHGYDGLDWDLEGNDNRNSSINHFTPECLELVGTMSQHLKQNGFIVSMAPPQSYFDQSTNEFGLVNGKPIHFLAVCFCVYKTKGRIFPKLKWHNMF